MSRSRKGNRLEKNSSAHQSICFSSHSSDRNEKMRSSLQKRLTDQTQEEIPDVRQRDGEFISLADVAVFLQLYKIGIVFWTAVGIAVAAFYVYTAEPTFVARTQIVIDPKQAPNVQSRSAEVGFAVDTAQIETAGTVLQSGKILADVINQLRLHEDVTSLRLPNWNPLQGIQTLFGSLPFDMHRHLSFPESFPFRGTSAPPATTLDPHREALEALANAVSVRRIGTSNALEISFASPKPEQAAEVANAIAAAFVQEQVAARSEAARQSTEWLEQGVRRLRTEMIRSSVKMQEIKARHDYRIGKPSPGETPSTSESLEELETITATHRALYESYLQALTGSLQRESFPVPEARVITPAVAPQRESYPRTKYVLAFGGLAGLLAGLGLSIVRNNLDQRVRTSRQLRAMHLNCLAEVPRLTRAQSGSFWHFGSGGKVSVLTSPLSPFSESLKSLRANLVTISRSATMHCVGITSSRPGEGKSTISSNLAALFSAAGYRTVLIDGDLRSPSLTLSLAPSATLGLTDALRGSADLRECLVRCELGELTFLPARSAVSAEAEEKSKWSRPGGKVDPEVFLGGKPMENMIGALKETFDIVIIDLPPLGATADAIAVSPLLDGIIVLAEWGGTPIELLSEVSGALRSAKAKIIGSVITKVNSRTCRYSYNYSRRYARR